MSIPILSTKLYIPASRPQLVTRSRLFARLDAGVSGKLTLVSAPAGFGKTTLVSTWVIGGGRPVAWFSLDEGDNDPTRFLAYLIKALQTIAPTIGVGIFNALQTPQPPPAEALLTALLNEIAAMTDPFIVVFDDYHVIDAALVDNFLTMLLDYLPPAAHIVVTTRQDPAFPVARLRARGQLNELRAADLRFTPTEAADFLTRVMGLTLSIDLIAALEARTEGWIAGLQLAAISLQHHPDAGQFIASFTGNHRFILDYLVEEVLHQQSPEVQTFLLRTAILERMTGELCDVLTQAPAAAGEATLSELERANLFIIPLDDERRWYRYHHLFRDLLRQRLNHSASPTDITEYHKRASLWYESNGLDAEAFHHAVASGDIDHAARLVAGNEMPLPFRGVIAPVLNWLDSLARPELDKRPWLWVIYASTLLFAARLRGIEERLAAAEAALAGLELNEKTRDMLGHIALIRATVAVSQHDGDTIMTQSLRAQEYLSPQNFPVRTASLWTLGHAHFLRGDLTTAQTLFSQALEASLQIKHRIIIMMSSIGLGRICEAKQQHEQAIEHYQRAIEIAGDPPQPASCEAHLGLGRIYLARGEFDAAQRSGYVALQLARQLETTDRAPACETFLEQVKQARTQVLGKSPQPLIEPLSPREIEVLQLVADGLSNQEISEKLFLALSTVKGHNQRIFDKLAVQRRTEAIARARELGLIG